MINGNNNEAARENKGAIHVVSRRNFILLLGAAMGSAALAGCSGGSSSKDDASSAGDAKQEEPVTVVDFDGKEVAVPADVSRIGALLGNSFPQIFFLGGAPKVAVRMDMKDTEWVKVVCPEFDGYGIKSIENPRDPNVEDLIAEGVDLVLYWGGLDDQVKRMNDVGVPVVVSNPSVADFKTTAEWRDLIEEEMMLYADVLGAESKDKAQEWLDYVDGEDEEPDRRRPQARLLHEKPRGWPSVFRVKFVPEGSCAAGRRRARLQRCRYEGQRLYHGDDGGHHRLGSRNRVHGMDGQDRRRPGQRAMGAHLGGEEQAGFADAVLSELYVLGLLFRVAA